MINLAVPIRILDYEGFGVATFLRELLGALRALPEAPNLTLLSSPTQASVLELPGTTSRIVHPNPARTLGRLVWDHVGVGLAAQAIKADVVLAPIHVRPAYCPCPSVVVVHDMMYHLFPEMWPRLEGAYMRLGVNHLTSRASAVVCVSHSCERDLLRFIPTLRGRTHVIHHGTPSAFTGPSPGNNATVLEKYKLHKPFLLSVAADHPRKNTTSLIEAFERIAPQIEHDLVLVGPNLQTNGALMKQIRTSSYSPRLRMLGLVPTIDLRCLYESAEIFILPSSYEGFGLPALEAMACGAPVIAVNSSSMPEVVGDAGVLLASAAPETIAAALVEVCKNEAMRNKFRQQGLDRARNFIWEGSARRYLSVLEEASKGR